MSSNTPTKSADPEAPVLKKKKNLSPVWILPILAAVLGLWLLVGFIQERGSDIVVRFPSATGIEANKTLVRYQGIVVGQVSKVSLAEDRSSVDVSLRMQNSVDELLRQQTQFWLVSPKASLTGIDGLDALFSGNYIAMQPGEGKRRTDFIGLAEAPLLAAHSEGLMLQLLAKQRGSLNIGSGLYYQQIKVGEVIDYQLQSDGSGVLFTAFIERDYRHLARSNSRFWNISGAAVHADKSGIDVQVPSLATLVAGGIAFSSPDDGQLAQPEQQFTLFDNDRDASPKLPFTLTATAANGLSVGSAIRYRGVDIGEISAINLGAEGVTIAAFVEPQYQQLLNSGTRFSQVKAQIGLNGVANLDTLIFGDVIRLWPGSGQPQSQFALLDKAPDDATVGSRFILRQDKLKGVSVGAPLRYRGVAVGEVLAVKLTPDEVDIEVLVEPQYANLVRQNSRFWLHGAVAVSADFSELSVTAAPLADAIHGGIAFSSSSNSPQADAGQRFDLADSRDAALAPTPIRLTLTTDSLIGLNPGAPVFYRDLQVGKVAELSLQQQTLAVAVEIEQRYQYLIGRNTRFWHYSGIEVEGSLASLKVRANPLISMVRGGLSLGHVDHTVAEGEFSDHHIYASEALALHNSHTVRLILNGAARIDNGAPIRYQGHQVGEVTDVQLSADLQQQQVTAKLEMPWASQFVRSDAQYYLVQPEIGLSGVRNVQTILSGNHIGVLPGRNQVEQSRFTIATEEPLQLPFADGLRLVLNQTRLGSLHIGSPVLYRQIRVGEVVHTRLAENGNSVDIEVQLQPQYQHLVNASSRFWNASGVDIQLGVFSGADIKTESLETILSGGIAFATETSTNDRNRLDEGQRLPLYDQVNSRWLEWAPRL
ncbi:MlaD family protein [Ferrimonas senticii]|uniref:MlaD family protein n=1 Tax=Ferrimonas senticii TaxID=394566 RepID=UPI00048130A5|nr:MlaD family protein [Ferrimonas senticii]